MYLRTHKSGDRCSVSGCESLSKKKGLCNKHYLRKRKHGDTSVSENIRGSDEDRFYAYTKIQSEGCWLWTGNLNEDGYGKMNANGKKVSVHRWSYEYFVGKIPDGLTIDHQCNVRNCVNPEHLKPMTIGDNAKRSLNFSGNRTHCRNGHEYTPENTIRQRSGRWISRRCKICHYDSVKRYRNKKEQFQ